MPISLSLGSCNCRVRLKVCLQKRMQLLCSPSAWPRGCRGCPAPQHSRYFHHWGGDFQYHNLTGTVESPQTPGLRLVWKGKAIWAYHQGEVGGWGTAKVTPGEAEPGLGGSVGAGSQVQDSCQCVSVKAEPAV